MREPEFLPAWYPLLRRRRRLAGVQAWSLLVILAWLGVWGLMSARNVRTAAGAWANVKVQLDQTDIELKKLNEQQSLNDQLHRQNEVAARLGTHIPAAKLMAMLFDVMPKEMALTALSAETIETPKPVSALLAARGDQFSKPVPARKMRVTLTGVVPTNEDLAQFLTRLTAVPFVQGVDLGATHDRTLDRHQLREFTVKFSIDLGSSEN